MTTHPESDDPIRQAFAQYQRAPRDIVPPTVDHTIDDLRRLADGNHQVRLTHYEITEGGVTMQTEWVTITQPIIDTDREETR